MPPLTMNNSTVTSSPQLNTTTAPSSAAFDPSNVNLQTVDPKDVICYLTILSNDYGDGRRAARLSSVFVIFFVSTVSTMFPVVASRVERLRIPLYVYLMIRYFGAGVIIATAFIHLLDPAYSEIGPQTCVGLTGAWSSYSWPPALAMTSAMCMFLVDFIIECHVSAKLGLKNVNVHGDVEGTVTISPEAHQSHSNRNSQHGGPSTVASPSSTPQQIQRQQGNSLSSSPPSSSLHIQPTATILVNRRVDEDDNDEKKEESPPFSCPMLSEPNVTIYEDDAILCSTVAKNVAPPATHPKTALKRTSTITSTTSSSCFTTTPATAASAHPATCPSTRSFENQIAAFLVLEFGVIFHSIIIGLNLGVAGTEFRTLYPVLVFHQCFEGMGIGARLSVIPFPDRFRLVPWLLCLAFGLTTPIAVAVGLSLRSSYSPNSFTADVVSGVFDSISAGILLYTGFVELLARDFLFHPERSLDKYRVSFMICCLYLGMAIMGLLGKWA